MKSHGLNQFFRTVWNAATGTWQAVAESAKGRGKTKSSRSNRSAALLAAGSFVLMGTQALAADLPTGGNVVAGAGSISQSGSSMTVNQATGKMAVDWQSFRIGQGNTVTFNQPSASAVALNRVLGSDVSVIQGALKANGQVFLVNPNGVLFTPTAQVNVGSLVASTLTLSTADFMAGNYKFDSASGHTGEGSAVMNQGNITAVGDGTGGGTIALIAAKITNTGTLTADKGNVLLGAGSKVTLDMGGPVKLLVENDVLETLITNGGAIRANGGTVLLTSQAAATLASSAINNTGLIEAQSLTTGEKGEIILFAHGGTTNVSGTLDATGGFIETSGEKLAIANTTIIKADTWLLDPTDITISAASADTLTTGGDGEKLSGGPTVSSAAIMSALASTDVIITTTDGDINVNSALTYGGTHGLYLKAYNDININADITVNGTAKLALFYGWSGTGNNYGNRGGVNVKMNDAHTAFDAKVTLNDSSRFLGVGDAGGVGVEYTVIRNRAQLSDIDAGYSEFVEAGSGSIDIADVNNALANKYALGADIDLAGSDWLPIGDWSYSFTGTLNGLGHTIANLTGPSLFGVVDNINGSISNLGFTNLNVTYGALSYSGYFVNISNIFASGTLTGDWENMGGIFSEASDGAIKNVHSHVTMPAYNASGGLVGYGENLNISNSSATGNITYDTAIDDDVEYVGGLVGVLYGGSITNSFATGNINIPSDGNNSAQGVGGLAGWLDNVTVSQSFATGNISAGEVNNANSDAYDIGGLVGGTDNSTIERSYATGNVSGNDRAGGLIGDARGSSIDQSFASGTVSADIGNDVGGLTAASYDSTSITNSYFNSTANPADASGFGNATTLVELKTTSTYTGWDFEDTFGISSSLNGGLPYLKWAYTVDAEPPTPTPTPTPTPAPAQVTQEAAIASVVAQASAAAMGGSTSGFADSFGTNAAIAFAPPAQQSDPAPPGSPSSGAQAVANVGATGSTSASSFAGIGGFSDGLAFVNMPAAATSGSGGSTGGAANASQGNAGNAGVEAFGFKKVFVLGGGIKLSGRQSDDAAEEPASNVNN